MTSVRPGSHVLGLFKMASHPLEIWLKVCMTLGIKSSAADYENRIQYSVKVKPAISWVSA